MRHLFGISLCLCAGITLSGCVNTPDEETPLWVYSTAGAAVGGMAGGYVGSGLGATVMSVGGATVGGLLGYKAGIAIEGKPLRDQSDKAFQIALNNPSTDPVLWEGVNADGHDKIQGSVTARPVFLNGSGQQCRHVSQILRQDTREVQEDFMACGGGGAGQWNVRRMKG